MSFTKILSFLACIQPILFFTSTSAATFDITNRCAYTVWAAASPGGGRRLDSGQSWQINVPPGTTQGRIWGRTNCIFDGNGQGRCQTGDCNGELQCQGYGQGPNTMAEFAINQANHLDFMDISLVDGFNIPMEFGPTTDVCRNLRCTVQINDQCPNELRAPGGCNNPCSLYNTSDYCCTNGSEICGSTTLSSFFKERCPDAYSYPLDDQISTFTCPAGTNYKVVFCGGRTFTSFTVTNLCSYTVWAAAFPGGSYGGKRLDPGQSSQISFASGVQARIWGRTNCSFNGSGRGQVTVMDD